ncbi:pyridoxamine 5'-phosphate oxidase family protein [Brucella sp. 21LCYQ03]|nr:pyridoxamine 5'-phosphate oxidase family protein [Brucella sp. 21LCYQ03]
MSEINPIRPTTSQAIDLAKTLLRSSRYGALAAIDAKSGRALASRVAVATDIDGTPIILVSGLAAHTSALLANPLCSLLLGEAGKGDPLAHPRITILCEAAKIDRSSPQYPQIRRRYLNHNPKGALYVDLGDFNFFRLSVENASLNGGFGKAFNLSHDNLISNPSASATIGSGEQEALDTFNTQFNSDIITFTSKLKGSAANWKLIGLDPDGFELASGDEILRLNFSSPCDSIAQHSKALVMRLRGEK